MNVVESENAVTVEPGRDANAAVIWLHGLGADGYDFLPVVPELKLPATVAARFVFPHAPIRPVTLNGGAPMRAWYDLYGLNRAAAQDERGLRASAALVDALLDAQVAAGVSPGRIVLAGFSQGGGMALHVGLRRSEALAGIMALSAYLPLEMQLEREITVAGRATPLLMCHGSQDPVLAFSLGTHSRDALRSLGMSVEWHEYPMGHEVCPAEIRDISAWMRTRFSAV
jgi:phospholipase/carboxylesterase